MKEKDLNISMMKTRLFSGLTHEECSMLRELSQAVLRSYSAGEVFVEEGGVIDFFAIVIKGSLFCEKNDYSGRVELIQNCSDGDLICLDIVCTITRRCPFSLICKKNSELLLFRYDALMSHEALPDTLYEKLNTNIIQFLANENVKKLYKIDVLYKKSLRERIMVFLRNMEARTGRNAMRIHMDREQFAQYLGVNRSSLSHELSMMRNEGLFRFKKDYFELAAPPAARPESAETQGPDGNAAPARRPKTSPET
jgi:CRP-like cAMP-binding protein